MKPGNLFVQGAKSGGKTKDEDSINSRIESSVCGFLFTPGILRGFHVFADLLSQLCAMIA